MHLLFLLLLHSNPSGWSSAYPGLVFPTVDLIYFHDFKLLCVVFQDLHHLISACLSCFISYLSPSEPRSSDLAPSLFPNTSFASSFHISISWFHYYPLCLLRSCLILQESCLDRLFESDLSSNVNSSPLSCWFSPYDRLPWIHFDRPVLSSKGGYKSPESENCMYPMPWETVSFTWGHVMAGPLIHEHSSTEINSVHSSTQLSMSLKVQYWNLNMRCECDKVKKTRERK